MLGGIPGATFDTLDARLVTFWREHWLRRGVEWGAICHTFTDAYADFLRELPAALAAAASTKLAPR